MTKGAALPMVLVSLGIAGALAVGGAYVTRQFAGDVRASQASLEESPWAEATLILAIAAWDSAGRSQQPLGTTVELPGLVHGDTRTRLWATSLRAGAYWLVAESETMSKVLMRRRLGVMVVAASPVGSGVLPFGWFELP